MKRNVKLYLIITLLVIAIINASISFINDQGLNITIYWVFVTLYWLVNAIYSK